MAVRKKRAPSEKRNAVLQANANKTKEEFEESIFSEEERKEVGLPDKKKAALDRSHMTDADVPDDLAHLRRSRPISKDSKILFLKTLIQQKANVSASCRITGNSQATLYNHKKKDKHFSRMWDEIVDSVTEEAERELYKRGVEGFQEELTYQGMATGDYITKRSDTCLIFYLKGNREKYRRTDAHHTEVNVNTTVDIVDDSKLHEIAGAGLEDEDVVDGEFEEVAS